MLIIAGAFLFVAAEAQAQDKKEGEEAPKVKVERGKGGKKVYRITTSFVIEGRIQKPNAFYVLERSQINYGWVQLKLGTSPFSLVQSPHRTEHLEEGTIHG